MDPFNFADALLGILAQRLAKRLCDCKTTYVPDAEELRLFVKEYSEELRHSSAWKADADAKRANWWKNGPRPAGWTGQLQVLQGGRLREMQPIRLQGPCRPARVCWLQMMA